MLAGVAGLAVWSYLLAGRGRFWRSGPVLPRAVSLGRPVTVIVPARNEAEHIGESLSSLLRQSASDDLRVLLVDDGSTDGTGERARSLAQRDPRLRVLEGTSLPAGWTGKLWAVAQGLAQPEAQKAAYVLLTDADILHGAGHLPALLHMAEAGRYDLVSEMVRLRTESLPERALIPAFVFFFQLLYPFAWVGDPRRPEAAAAGGTILLSRAALDRIGGVDGIRGELIDDVALARAVKQGGHRIWLGHAEQAVSLRRYPGFADVWSMIRRTAYVQLRHSPLLLTGTVAGLLFVYVQPVLLAVLSRRAAQWSGAAAWAMMALAVQPTLRRYRRSPLWGFALPGMALFYLGATVASALHFHRGRGGAWKGRTYPVAALDAGVTAQAAAEGIAR